MNVAELTLRIVSLNDVLLHEYIEADRVAQVVVRIQGDWFLKNPPIVSPCGEQYVLLDGATRCTALKRLGCRDVVVQIVADQTPGLMLETWNHLLVGLPLNDFLQSLNRLEGLMLCPTTIGDAADRLMNRSSIGTLLLPDGCALSLGASSCKLSDQVRLLNGIVGAYEGHGELHRVIHADMERLRQEYSGLSALMVFPHFRPDEIQQIAMNGNKLPTGITRHIIPGRAMRLNIPLDVLTSAESLGKKNQWFAEWLKLRMRERHVRYYQEPVILFDE